MNNTEVLSVLNYICNSVLFWFDLLLRKNKMKGKRSNSGKIAALFVLAQLRALAIPFRPQKDLTKDFFPKFLFVTTN